MLSHTLAKMLLAMDDVPVVVRGRGDELCEVGGTKDVMARKHTEAKYYIGLWFDVDKDDKKSRKVIELR